MSDVREGYKKTEIGEIPVEWKVDKITDYIAIRSGLAPSKIPNLLKRGRTPYYKVDDMNYSKKYLKASKNKFDNIDFNLIRSNSIIFPKRGASIFTNKIAITTEECMIDTNLMVLEILDESVINYEYLYYILYSKELSKIADTSSIPQINNKHIELIKLAIPSIIEQKKISEILSTVDTQIEQTEQLIEKTKELKKGLMQQLLTKGIGHSEFKKCELGEIPVSWKVARFDAFMILQRGFDLPSQERKIGDVPIMSANGQSGTHSEYKVEGPGVVTGRSGTIGKVHFVEKNFWPLNTSLYIKEMYDNEPKYIYYFLTYFKLERFGTGTGVPTLNRNDVHLEKVAFPPKEEQQKIAEILSTVDFEIESYEQEKAKYEELKKGLMQQLLTGKIRVKID